MSCGRSKTKNQPKVAIQVLIDSVENYGSVNAFDQLETASLDYKPGHFLSTFMIMADKYNNAFASMTVYRNLLQMYNPPMIEGSKNGIYALDSLNQDMKMMVLRYLKKADSLGNQEAIQHSKEYKLRGIIN